MSDIGALEVAGSLPVVPQGTLDLASAAGLPAPVQPVRNVPAYLETRRPVADCDDEKCLFLTLPDKVREETSALCRACKFVFSLVKARLKVEPACRRALSTFDRAAREFRWTLKTFRAKYDAWSRAKDWVVLVNKAKAGPLWQRREDIGLPDSFLDFVAQRFARARRRDAKRQAIEAIKRQWRTGLNLDGELEAIPGYTRGWCERNTEILPEGWHYSNILRQIKGREKFTASVRALLHEGTAGAKEHLPQVLGSRRDLRFLEVVTFDDVRTDWLIFDTKTGQPCELWLLVARDQATGMVLGFVMHPSRAREDGSDSHLGLREMKQLAGWLLERYPLPPYICTWKVERGTATLSEGSRAALQELLPNRIRVSYTSMIGGRSPVGYREKSKGNSRGKASHESHNRLFHTQAAALPGQTGANYEIRPADLDARARECVEIWEMRNSLPEHLRGREKYTLLTEAQAREHLFRFCIEQNFRTDHKLEGFDEVLEWYDPADGKWRPQATAPYPLPDGARLRKRMERPVERALRLMQGYKFERVSPEVIAAFYAHTVRSVTIESSGEVSFTANGRQIRFAPPAAGPHATRSALAYFHPDDPKYLHVTDGRGAFLGTWLRRDRVAMRDQDALEDAFRYTDAALKAAQAQAERLAAPEREELAAIRAHNAELANWREYIDVAQPQLDTAPDALTSPVAAALTAVVDVRTSARETSQREARRAAEEILAPAAEPSPKAEGPDAGDELLSILSAHTENGQHNDH